MSIATSIQWFSNTLRMSLIWATVTPNIQYVHPNLMHRYMHMIAFIVSHSSHLTFNRFIPVSIKSKSISKMKRNSKERKTKREIESLTKWIEHFGFLMASSSCYLILSLNHSQKLWIWLKLATVIVMVAITSSTLHTIKMHFTASLCSYFPLKLPKFSYIDFVCLQKWQNRSRLKHTVRYENPLEKDVQIHRCHLDLHIINLG